MIQKLNARRFGMACGVVGGVFYLGCVILMVTVGTEGLIFLANGLLHGLDVTPIIVSEVGFLKTILGLINTIVLAWLFGGLMAAVYNVSLPKA